MSGHRELEEVKGIGGEFAKALGRLRIRSREDLLGVDPATTAARLSETGHNVSAERLATWQESAREQLAAETTGETGRGEGLAREAGPAAAPAQSVTDRAVAGALRQARSVADTGDEAGAIEDDPYATFVLSLHDRQPDGQPGRVLVHHAERDRSTAFNRLDGPAVADWIRRSLPPPEPPVESADHEEVPERSVPAAVARANLVDGDGRLGPRRLAWDSPWECRVRWTMVTPAPVDLALWRVALLLKPLTGRGEPFLCDTEVPVDADVDGSFEITLPVAARSVELGRGDRGVFRATVVIGGDDPKGRPGFVAAAIDLGLIEMR